MVFKRIQFAIEGRSGKWAALRRNHLKINPSCVACNSTENLEVHHIKPFKLFPEFELDDNNLMTMCKHCHLVLGHLRDYEIYNKNVVGLVNIFVCNRARYINK